MGGTFPGRSTSVTRQEPAVPGLPRVLDSVADHPVELRRATVDDVAAIVSLLVDDPLGRTREQDADRSDLSPYLAAFAALDSDPAQLLVVAADGARLVATMQLTFIVGLARRGSRRLQIEAVRVAASHRGNGLGAAMMGWAVEYARQRGCVIVQLTSDKSRIDAHRFYQRLGFVASHEGFKLSL
jgi:GNAT superfamily N-acetyltransferase